MLVRKENINTNVGNTVQFINRMSWMTKENVVNVCQNVWWLKRCHVSIAMYVS